MSPSDNRIAKLIRKYLPDLIYGANDGIVTSIVVVSSVTGASLPVNTVLILGFANLFADGLSMAASNYLSSRSHPEQSNQMTRKLASYHGFAAFAGFTIAGFIPLTAYLFPFNVDSRFIWASVFALTALFTIGALRALFTKSNWLREGLEMLVVGMVASGIAYLIGLLGASLVNKLQ